MRGLLLVLALIASGMPVAHAELDRDVERPRPTLNLHIAGLAGAATVRDVAFDGEATYTLAGGRLTLEGHYKWLRYEIFGEFASGRRTRVTDAYQMYGVSSRAHRAYVVGLRLGFDWRRLRVDVGAMGSQVATESGRNLHEVPLFAYARVSVGRRARVAGSWQLGSTDAYLMDGRVFDVGMLFERERFCVRATVGIGVLFLPDLASDSSWDEGTLARARLGPVDAIADIELSAHLTERISLDLWLQTGSQLPRGRIGVGFAL